MQRERKLDENSITSLRLQEEGNLRAEASDFSAAVRLWDRALLYAPRRAALHELKSHVLLHFLLPATCHMHLLAYI